jgi:hypothetical protein
MVVVTILACSRVLTFVNGRQIKTRVASYVKCPSLFIDINQNWNTLRQLVVVPRPNVIFNVNLDLFKTYRPT